MDLTVVLRPFDEQDGRRVVLTFQGVLNIRFIPSSNVPSLDLEIGYEDAGMSGGCEWESFELSEEEYAEVRHAIAHDQRLAGLPIPSLDGSDERVRDIKEGYWIWDMDKGGWVSDDDLPPRLEDIKDIPF